MTPSLSGSAVSTLPIVCFGECMVELRPQAEGLWRQAFAGDTCNTAVYLARLLAEQGPAVCWAMGTGDDPFAASMREFWVGEGLGLSLLRSVSGGRTGLYAIHVDGQGERHFSYWRDTSAARTYFDAAPDGSTPLEQHSTQLQGLHFSAISLAILPPAGRARLMACAQAIRRNGGWVSFDTNYRPALWEDAAVARHAICAAMVASDRVLVSMDEWLALTGAQSEALALDALRALQCPELVIKRGGQHSWVSLLGAPVQVAEVAPIGQPVDTTAAGDAFAAGYLAARLRGRTPLAAAQVGNALAAAVVMHPGAIIPSAAMPALGLDK
ncbi:sugar kinase [Rhodoferax sp.]|uniref:sugar kinase n=1 Tax=Rhodoferax sp. TaxID=50421 RepID=UPI0025E26151|nr:sugar kinase [Rhodoferax sp.]